MKFGRQLALVASSVAMLALAGNAQATLTTIPQSALVASDYYYTDLIGGGIGNVVVTTGGGNAANVGAADGRNDDGFSLVNLGFTINYLGSSYTSLYINNNGNVSFGSGISACSSACSADLSDVGAGDPPSGADGSHAGRDSVSAPASASGDRGDSAGRAGWAGLGRTERSVTAGSPWPAKRRRPASA